MPALTLPLFGLSLGASFAWLAADEVARVGGVAGTRSLWVVALFGVLVFGPATAYLLSFSPDWAYAYFLDPGRLPAVAPMVLALACALTPCAGFALTAGAAALRKPALVLRSAFVPAAVALLATLLLLKRLGVYATYAQFHGDFGTESVAGSPLGYALLWMGGIVVLGCLWTVHVLRRLAPSPARH